MILADEVGLGKTIEAGLIIKELRARGLADRILIVCPSSLQLQWQQELQSKFNESFEVLDSAAMKYLGRGGANPWARFDSVICSLPFASHRTRQDAIIESDWDLVVFDEAHRVRRWRQGKQPKVTQAYRLADELKELTTGLGPPRSTTWKSSVEEDRVPTRWTRCTTTQPHGRGRSNRPERPPRQPPEPVLDYPRARKELESVLDYGRTTQPRHLLGKSFRPGHRRTDEQQHGSVDLAWALVLTSGWVRSSPSSRYSG